MKKHHWLYIVIFLGLLSTTLIKETTQELPSNVTYVGNTTTTTTTVQTTPTTLPEPKEIKYRHVVELKPTTTEPTTTTLPVNKTRLWRNYSPHALCEDCGSDDSRTIRTVTTTTIPTTTLIPPTTTTIPRLCEFPWWCNNG